MLVLEVIVLVVFWGWVVSALLLLDATILPRVPRHDGPEDHDLEAETVSITSSDGVRLDGWRMRVADAARPWIILCHGLRATRAELADRARALHAAGFNVLLMGFRGHGAGGRTTSHGWREQRDLEGALAFLGQQADVAARPLGVYGISMGASVALMVAARDERIGAVAADSPYASLEEALASHMRLAYPWLPRAPFLWFLLATYRLWYGVWPRHVAPEASIGRISPRALLLVQGTEDRRNPIRGARRLLEAAGDPKELWEIEGAGHLEAYDRDAAGYSRHLARFFTTHLQPASQAAFGGALEGGTA